MTKKTEPGNSPRKRYADEYKTEALGLADRVGISAAARELGLQKAQLYAWRSQVRQSRDRGEEERRQATEVARLKRQLAERDEL